jgi:hypothetical protein
MDKKSRTKKQHFIPRFYLEHFADGNGKLWTHDPVHDNLHYSTPENTGFETNIYTPEGEDGTRMDIVEETLSKVESSAAQLLPDLLAFKKLGDSDKAEFAMFLATMFARSPAQLRQFAAHQGKVAHWLGRVEVEHELRRKEELGTLSKDDEQTRLILTQKDIYEIHVDRRVGLVSFQQCEVLANLMKKMTWTFEVSENQELLTSDNSVFWVNGGGPIPVNGPYGFGLGHPQAVIPFPLNPGIILRLDWQPGLGWTKHRLFKSRAKLSNQYQAKHKNRFLYFRTRDEGFRKLGMKYAEPVQQLDSGVDGPDVNVVRTLKEKS